MKINEQIFREYDIRGIVDEDLSPEFAYLLGRAYGTLAKDNGKSPIAIGHDCRLTSPIYAQKLAEGIAAEGVNVVLTGMGPTPQLYFSIFHQDLGGGIQVTGSHNPSNMNGFKICLGKKTLSGEMIQDLKKRMLSLNETEPTCDKPGTITEIPIQETYLNDLTENVKPHMGARKLKVVVDAGNGVGGMMGPELLRNLGVEVVELYCEPDGNFPNHHPDPTEMENIVDLQAKVKEVGADFGVGWDGDADRIGVVDENGKPIFGDMLVLIYARKILEEIPGATVIGDVKCSSHLFSDLKKRGANPIMWKTGHSLMKSKLQETNGELAGEMSGHIFFKHRFYGFDDALYATARFVEIMSHYDGKISEYLSDLPEAVSTPEIRVDCPEDIKFKIPELAKEAFSDFEISTIDGVRIEFDKGWGLVRASNTQPVLVQRFEAENEQLLTEYKKLVQERVEEIKAKATA